MKDGEWDDGKLVWARRIEGDDAVAAPALCYATWVTPNDKIQRRLFGETILNGETLFEVCLQHAGLNEKERRDWENLLEKVPPVAEWKPQFDALRAQLEAEHQKWLEAEAAKQQRVDIEGKAECRAKQIIYPKLRCCKDCKEAKVTELNELCGHHQTELEKIAASLPRYALRDEVLEPYALVR